MPTYQKLYRVDLWISQKRTKMQVILLPSEREGTKKCSQHVIYWKEPLCIEWRNNCPHSITHLLHNISMWFCNIHRHTLRYIKKQICRQDEKDLHHSSWVWGRTCIEIDDRNKKLREGAQEDIQWTCGVIPLRGMRAFDNWRERKDVSGSGNTGLRDAQVTYW